MLLIVEINLCLMMKKSQQQPLPKFPKSRTKMFIHPLVWMFFMTSALLFVTVVFLTTGTSNGPAFYSPQEVKEKLLSNHRVI